MIDIVVLNYNDGGQVVKYVNQIQSYKIIDHIVIVDNCSTDDSLMFMSKLKSVKIHVISTDHNGGYGYGNNFGIMYAREQFGTKYIAVTNPDVEFSEECVKNCISFLENNENKDYAVVAPQMLNLKNEKTDCAWLFPTWYSYAFCQLLILGKLFKGNFVSAPQNSFVDCDCVAGSMLIIRTEFFVKAGMYDENIFLYCEEMVLGKRLARIGYKTALLGNCSFVHAHSVSIKKSMRTSYIRKRTQWKSREYVLSKYYQLSKIDKIIVIITKWVSLAELRIGSIILKR